MDSIDDYYIWQRRIVHGIRNKKCTVPFPECVRLGLEFNPCVERKEKLDSSLLTNAMVLEISHFAKVVKRSEKNFLFEMLAFNFDLGLDLDDDKLCHLYSRYVHNKIKVPKEILKASPSDPTHSTSQRRNGKRQQLHSRTALRKW
ncbi:uncharacterized protein KZ484_018224 [Pholidichthys leucotaenia]